MKLSSKLLIIFLFIILLISNVLFINKRFLLALDFCFIGFIINYYLILIKSKVINSYLLLRLFLLSSPAFIANLAWFLDHNLYRAHYHALFIQTNYVTAFISIATLYALVFNTLLIFKFGSNYSIFNFYKLKEFFKTKSIAISYKKARIAALISLAIGSFFTIQRGFKLITQEEFVSRNFDTPIDSVLGVLHNIFVSIVISHLWVGIKDKRSNILLYICLISYLFPLIDGARCDYIIGFFTILILIINKTKFYKKLRNSFKDSTIFFYYGMFFLGSFIFLFITRFISLWRIAYGNLNLFETIKLMILNPSRILFIEKEGYKIFNFDTINHVLGSFYSFGYKVLEQGQDFLYGKSYLEYFTRLIPSTFRQGITLQYQLEMNTSIYNYLVTQGGNLEIAEAFYNFGLLGLIIISLFTSSLLIIIARRSEKNLTLIVLFLTISFESFRYIWYQYFALFKILSVFLLFYPLINYLSPKIIKNNFPKKNL